MNIAIDKKNGKRIEATPSNSAICSLCNQEVISKCGDIKIWHWSHKKNIDCDSFGEPETYWHLNWKNNFEKEFQEITIGEHRADIKNKETLVIEFQNSPLSAEKIQEREEFYKNMIWIINGQSIAKNLDFKYNKTINGLIFDWKWFPSSWFYAKKPIYIDISYFDIDILFKIELLQDNGCGIGKRISKTAFIIENGGKPWLNKEVEDGEARNN